MMIVGGVFGLARGRGNGAAQAQPLLPAGTAACLQASCRATNPQHARFCRRCGIALARDVRGGPVRMRYVA